MSPSSAGHLAAFGCGPSRRPSSAAPLRSRCPSEVDAGHPGGGGELDPVRRGRVRPGCGRAGRTPAWRTRRSSGLPEFRRRGWTAGRRRRVLSGDTRVSGTKAAACRLPRVMVPVLSSSRVLTSPAASTARPDMASTLRCTSRSMPAMPMARQQRADGRRDEADQQRDHHDAGDAVAVERQACPGHRGCSPSSRSPAAAGSRRRTRR